MFISPESIIQGGGLLLLIIVIFAETGLLVGFFLPGDTLLLAAGIFASQGHLPLEWTLILLSAAAIAGYQAGYFIGEKAGPKVFKRHDGLLFRQEYITRTEAFFTKHGGKTVLLARFVPVVRTVAPLVAGIGNMSKRKFFMYNVAGAVLWIWSITLAAYWLGRRVPDLDKIILPLLLLAVILTTGSVLLQLMGNKVRRQHLKAALKDELKYLLRPFRKR